MAFPPDAAPQALDDARLRAVDAADVDAAMAALATALAPGYGIARASLRVLVGGDRLLVVAVWGDAETRLPAGSVMSILSSSMPDAVVSGRPITGEPVGGLLEDILRSEGIQSWISIPLHADGKIAGLLSFSSRNAEELGDADVSFFERLGRAVEEPLLRLARSAESL